MVRMNVPGVHYHSLYFVLGFHCHYICQNKMRILDILYEAIITTLTHLLDLAHLCIAETVTRNGNWKW